MGNKLYVGNLSFRVTSEDLQEYFGAAGAVESANVVYDRETGLFDHLQLDAKKPVLSLLAMERVGNELWVGTYQAGLYVLNASASPLLLTEGHPSAAMRG